MQPLSGDIVILLLMADLDSSTEVSVAATDAYLFYVYAQCKCCKFRFFNIVKIIASFIQDFSAAAVHENFDGSVFRGS